MHTLECIIQCEKKETRLNSLRLTKVNIDVNNIIIKVTATKIIGPENEINNFVFSRRV